MPAKPPDYDAIEQNLWRKNAKEVITRLNNDDKDLLKRIDTYVDRFGYDLKSVADKMIQDQMFAATFAKEPRRSGIHEKVAAEWLQRELPVKITTLPKTGEGAYYVTSDGQITTIAKEETKPSKSLDFYWVMGETNIYAMHKYTKEGGGNQDSQFNEMENLLKSFQRASNPSNILIVIVDGPYYNERRMNKLGNVTRDRDPKSFAVQIENVPEIMKNYTDKS